MVIKLIKNGFIDSWSYFRNVLATTVIASVIIAVLPSMSTPNSVILYSVLVLAMYALLIASFVLSIIAFTRLLYRSLYREEAYRAFTQPVATWEIFASKVVLTLIWTTIIAIVSVVSITIAVSFVLRDEQAIMQIVRSFLAYVGSVVDWSVIFVWVVENIVSIIFNTALFLMVGSIVNSRFFQNRRVLWFVVIYLVLTYLMSQLFYQFDTQVLVFSINPGFESAFETALYTGNIDWSKLFSIYVSGQGVQTVLLSSLLKVILAGFMGFITVWHWDNKLEVID